VENVLLWDDDAGQHLKRGVMGCMGADVCFIREMFIAPLEGRGGE
jgi:hypothetical protein